MLAARRSHILNQLSLGRRIEGLPARSEENLVAHRDRTFEEMAPKRVCQIIKLRPECYDEYVKLHDNAWPGVLQALTKAHFANYTIHYDPIHSLLIAHFEYTGDDWDADMKEIGKDEVTREWWKLTDSYQESLVPGAKESGEGAWWLDLKEVFRFEVNFRGNLVAVRFFAFNHIRLMVNFSKEAALVIVDVQNGFYFPPYVGLAASNVDAVNNIATLLTTFRSRNIPIIHVHQHSLHPESPFNPKTNPQGATVQLNVAPLSTEKVILKHENSAFIGTDLEEYLKEKKITTLVLTGLTLEHCISATAKHAGNLGYNVLLPRETTSAFEVKNAPGGKESGTIGAETVQEVVLGALHNEFVTVVKIDDVVAAL